MQKPKFKTSEKAAWVFIHTRLHPKAPPTIDRRSATRNGFFTTAARLLNKAERDLPLPFEGEPMSKYIVRVQGK